MESKWRKEFESNFSGASMEKYDSGHYKNSHQQCMWAGFLMAKQSMPVIELPRTNWNPLLIGHFYSHGEIVKAIAAAGYKWEVKE